MLPKKGWTRQVLLVSNRWPVNHLLLEMLSDLIKKKVSVVALWWINKMPGGRNVWQNDLLESRARSRGDVIFFRGRRVVWIQDEDKFSKWKGRGGGGDCDHHITITPWLRGVKRGLQQRGTSQLWMSHPAPDALIHLWSSKVFQHQLSWITHTHFSPDQSITLP